MSEDFRFTHRRKHEETGIKTYVVNDAYMKKDINLFQESFWKKWLNISERDTPILLLEMKANIEGNCIQSL